VYVPLDNHRARCAVGYSYISHRNGTGLRRDQRGASSPSRSLSVPLVTFSRNEAGIEALAGLGVATSDGLPFVAGLSGEGNVNVTVAAELAGVNCETVYADCIRCKCYLSNQNTGTFTSEIPLL